MTNLFGFFEMSVMIGCQDAGLRLGKIFHSRTVLPEIANPNLFTCCLSVDSIGKTSIYRCRSRIAYDSCVATYKHLRQAISCDQVVMFGCKLGAPTISYLPARWLASPIVDQLIELSSVAQRCQCFGDVVVDAGNSAVDA